MEEDESYIEFVNLTRKYEYLGNGIGMDDEEGMKEWI